MWIRHLFLEDFGCFAHQHLRDLAQGLVVVAGPQRAGKTTLMRAVRHLGYGFRQRFNLPPAADRHHVEAELVQGDDRYRLRLQGYGEPQLAGLEGAADRTPEELYGNLQRFAYHQIFTLSLDELRRLPRSLGDHTERDLQTVLLGAGWADAVRIPVLQRELAQDAGKIGGKYGRSVALFKGPVRRIQQAVEARSQALAQVTAFDEAQKQLAALRQELTQRRQRVAQLEDTLQLLQLADEHLERVGEYRELRSQLERDENRRLLGAYPAGGAARAQELAEEYAGAREGRDRAGDRLGARVGEEALAERLQALLTHDEDLEYHAKEVAGWRARVENLGRRAQSLARRLNTLREDVARLEPAWADDLARLARVPTDLISRDGLAGHIKAYEEQAERRKRNREEQERLAQRMEARALRAGALAEHSLGSQLLVAAAGLAGILVAGYLLSQSWEPPWALALTVLAVLAWLGLRASPLSQAVRGRQQRWDLEQRQDEDRAELAALGEAVTDITESMAEAAAALQRVRHALQLPDSLSAQGVAAFYQTAVDLQAELAAVRGEEEELAGQTERLAGDLAAPAKVLTAVGRPPPAADGQPDLARRVGALDGALSEAMADLAAARAVAAAERQLTRLGGRIMDLLAQEEEERSVPGEGVRDSEGLLRALAAFAERGKTRRQLAKARDRAETLKEALVGVLQHENRRPLLEPYRRAGDEEPWALAALERAADQLAGATPAGEARAQVAEELAGEGVEVDACEKQQLRLENELERLRTDDNLRAAQETIDEARAELEVLAEEYAVRRLAAALLERLHDRFVEKAHGPLLAQAGEIFARITGGEYAAIEPAADLARVDYASRRGEAGRPEPTQAMSGGTREQLFLAVRLARIGGIEPPLPVILDDSAANFDPVHRRRLLAVLDELAKSHQIFVLTCHPEVVRLLADTGRSVQYWGLDRCRVRGPFAAPEEPLQLLAGR